VEVPIPNFVPSKTRDDESVRSPPVDANGTRPALRDETMRFVVLAVLSTDRCVVVAFVVVENAIVSPWVNVDDAPLKIMLEVVALTPT
jgi:hypothetical protein